MAEPIPSIADILAGVKLGTYTVLQAQAWIDVHISAAVEAALDRDAFAALAMQTLLADKKFVQDADNAGRSRYTAVADAAYQQADAMKIARTA